MKFENRISCNIIKVIITLSLHGRIIDDISFKLTDTYEYLILIIISGRNDVISACALTFVAPVCVHTSSIVINRTQVSPQITFINICARKEKEVLCEFTKYSQKRIPTT